MHVDLYRVRSAAEVEELGLRDLTVPDLLLLIEWPEKGGVAVPRRGCEFDGSIYAGDGRRGIAWAGTES